eukprot:m.140038 g.140038  ORF g.140038 m.140038 type:complete len:93 (+) comp52565_c0_seq1:187-465(+)
MAGSDWLQQLPAHFEQRSTPQGRHYYINHQAQSVSWLPPKDIWNLIPLPQQPLPYGWEQALTTDNTPYYLESVPCIAFWFRSLDALLIALTH